MSASLTQSVAWDAASVDQRRIASQLPFMLKHGGKRPGAGRKPAEDPRVTLSTRVASTTLRKLEHNAGADGVGRLIDKLAKRLPRPPETT